MQEQESVRAKRERRRTRRSANGRLVLFLLCAALVYAVLFVWAGNTDISGADATQITATPALLPLLATDSRPNWLANGDFSGSADSPGDLPAGWRLVTATTGEAAFTRRLGEPYLTLACTGPCVAGLSQRLVNLPSGDYHLEADIYLPTETTTAALAVRLGYDNTGDEDITSVSVHWSPALRQGGWQHLEMQFQHAVGSPATVFLVFDHLQPQGDCRVANIRLYGPPPIDKPATIIVSATPVLQPVHAVETRALYLPVEDWSWSGPEELQKIIDQTATAGFNILYFQVRQGGYAYYDSAIEPRAARLTEDWDPLTEAVTRGQAAGLKVYAWLDTLPVWKGEEAPADGNLQHWYNLFAMRYGNDWLQADTNGLLRDENSYAYASPLQPQTAVYLAAVCRDLAARYPVDGLLLSGLRYLSSDAGSDPAGQAAYQVAKGETELSEADFRRQALDRLVHQTSQAVREVRPEVRFAIEVWPLYHTPESWQERESYANDYADWQNWLANGDADELVLSFYMKESLQWPEQLAFMINEAAKASHGRQILAALRGETPTFGNIQRGCNRIKLTGANGLAIYDYSGLATRGYWDDLKQGPFLLPASVPPLFWR